MVDAGKVVTPDLIQEGPFTDDLIDIVKEIHKQGTTVFIVEQDVHLALSNSDYGYVLATGHVMMEGPSKELLNNKQIKEVFLGL